MKIAVITGTPVKGITCYMKDLFLEHFKSGNEIIEFYPKDLPGFCTGCKGCFQNGEDKCPHFSKVGPIWQAILEADLLVFAYPVYALRAPAAVKSLLDHLCVHWLVHRPDPKLFQKTAVILTNSVGAPNGAAQKDVKTSLTWMGISKVYTCGACMMGDIFLDHLTEPHREMLKNKTRKLAQRVSGIRPRSRKSIKVSLLFSMSKFQHKMVLKSEEQPCLDNQHYLDHGWIKPPDRH